jgi:hypothetical protein
MKMFEDIVTEEALRRPKIEMSDKVYYDQLHAKFTRAMETEEKHGPVRVLVANGRKLWD